MRTPDGRQSACALFLALATACGGETSNGDSGLPNPDAGASPRDSGPGGDGGGPPGCNSNIAFLVVDQPTTLTKACSPYHVAAGIMVKGELTIQPGVEINFAEGITFLVSNIGGPGATLIAEGTPDDPIVLQGDDAVAGPVRFDGVHFVGPVTARNVMRDVVMRRCGGVSRTPNVNKACIFAEAEQDDYLTLERIRFEDATVGLRVEGAHIDNPKALSFDDQTTVGLWFDANGVGDVDEAFTYGAGVVNHIEGRAASSSVYESATWVAQGVPWIVTTLNPIAVQARPDWQSGQPFPVLTLEAGVEIRLQREQAISVAEDRPGSIVVAGTAVSPVMIKAADPAAQIAGAIRGIDLRERTRVATFHHLEIHHGGARTGANDVNGACLNIHQTDSATISVTSSRFSDCRLAAVSTLDADLFRFTAFNGNTFESTGAGISMRPDAVASIGPDQTYTGTTGFNLIQPGPFVRDGLWLDQVVPYRLENDDRRSGLEIDARLTIQEGTTLAFGEEMMVRVAENSPGALVAQGFDTDPISFRGVGAMPWHGIVFYPGSDGSELNFVRIEDAGQPSGNIVQGCVTARGAAAGISIIDSLFQSCQTAGLGAVSAGEHFNTVARNQFIDMPVGLRLHADVVGEVPAQQYMGVPVNQLLGGIVSRDATWSDQGIPWNVESQWRIDVEAAVTIEPGNEIRFARQLAGIEVGDARPGSLRAIGTMGAPIVFTSSDPNPMPGDWVNIAFGPNTQNSVLDTIEIRFAGRGLRAAIDLNGRGALVRVANVTFSSLLAGMVEP